MDIEYIRRSIEQNLRERLYGNTPAEIDISLTEPENLLERHKISARRLRNLLYRIALLKRVLSGLLSFYRSKKDKMLLKHFSKQTEKTSSEVKLPDSIHPLQLSEHSEAPAGARENLKKVPILGGVLLWPWRLMKLPGRFHSLSIEFLQLQQRAGGYDQILSEANDESGRMASEIKEVQRRTESALSSYRKHEISITRTESALRAIEKIQDEYTRRFNESLPVMKSAIRLLEKKQDENVKMRGEFLRHLEGINERLIGLQKEHIDWTSFYMAESTEEFLSENIEHHRFFMDKVAEYANRASEGAIPKLLELGIGTATMSIYFSRGLYQVTGIDMSPDLIKKAQTANKRLGGHAVFICMDAFQMESFFKPAGFHVSFSQGTMEHFSNQDLGKMLSAQLHTAKYVLFSVPSENWPSRDFRDERKISKEEWKILLMNLGFHIDMIEYYRDGMHICCALKGQE